MITCVNSKTLSLKEQAQVLASWLRRCLSFPYEKQSAVASAAVLYREPPARSELAFQQKDGDASMKIKLIPLQSEELIKELFCLTHLVLWSRRGIKQKHTDPFTEMKRKQSRLLKYLRDNPEFMNVFLQEDGMNDFFKLSQESTQEKKEREKNNLPLPSTTPIVMGTRLFYLLCYNDQNDIWLQWYGCNITKGTQVTLAWFKKYLSTFHNDVDETGGLHSGLLSDKIYKQNQDDYLLTMDDELIRIPCESNPTTSIGELVRCYREYAYIPNKAFYEGIEGVAKEELENIRELRSNCEDKEADTKQEYLIKVLNQSKLTYTSALVRQHLDFESEGLDSSIIDKLEAQYKAEAVEAAKAHWHNRYCELKIKQWINEAYPNLTNSSASTETSRVSSSSTQAQDKAVEAARIQLKMKDLIKDAYPNSANSTNASVSSTADNSSNIFSGELLHDTGDSVRLESKQVDIPVEKVESLLKDKSPPPREEFRKIFLTLTMSRSDRIILELNTEKAQQEVEKQKQETETERLEAVKQFTENASTSSMVDSRSNIFLNELLRDAGDIALLESKQVDIIVEKVKSLLKDNSPPPPREEFRKIFLNLAMSRLVKAILEIRAEEARQEAEKHKQTTTIPSTSTITQTTSSTISNNPAFWQTTPSTTNTANTKKRALDAIDTSQLGPEAQPIPHDTKRTYA
jgi:hypothetical protein